MKKKKKKQKKSRSEKAKKILSRKKKKFKKRKKFLSRKKKKFKKIKKFKQRKKPKKKVKLIKPIFKSVKIKSNSKIAILSVVRLLDKIKKNFQFKFNIDQALQNFFQGISDKITNKMNEIKEVVEEEKERKKQLRAKQIQKEKIERVKQLKEEKKYELEKKQKELKEEVKLERDRKKDLHKFIRLEQAEVRREQTEKQRKFLEKIRLEKKIEQFRKREALEIKNLEKFVLSQERESYAGVQDRIDAIKQKYQALRDQKIRERIEELGIEVTESDDRAALLEKERQYNFERQKIELALESYYRSMASCVWQLNKKWIPKKMSLLRVIDKRFENSEVFIKLDEEEDEKWLMLVYIKDNNPDSGIVVEDKTNPEKNISTEYKTNEIFKFSDALVDSLTNYIDREFKKKTN
jgi:hypothetical protein